MVKNRLTEKRTNVAKNRQELSRRTAQGSLNDF